MVTGLSTTGLDLTRNEFLEFWVFQPAGEPADSAGLRLVVDLGTVSEDAVAIAPDTMAVIGADTLFTGRQLRRPRRARHRAHRHRHLQRRGGRHRHPGRPPADLRDPRRARSASSRSAPARWARRCRCLPLGRPQRPLHPGQRRARHRGPRRRPAAQRRRRERGRLPLRRGPRAGTTSTCATASPRATPRAAPPPGGSTASRSASRPRSINTPDAPAGEAPADHLRDAAGRRRSPTSSRGSRWRGCASSARPGPAGPIRRSSASAARPASRTARSRSASSAPRTGPTWATSRPPGSATRRRRRGGDRESGGTQINERSLRILADDLRQRRARRGVSPLPGRPAEPADLPDAAGLVPGPRSRDGRRAISRRSSSSGSDDDNFYLYRASARTDHVGARSDHRPRDLAPTARGRWRTAGSAGEPPSGAAECGTQNPKAYVACEGPYLVHLADPGINPPNLAAVQEISAGIYRVGAAGDRAARSSSGWTTSG